MCVHMIIVYPFAYIHFFTLQFLIVHNLNSHGRFQAKSHFQLVLLCSFQNHVSPATQMIPVSLGSFKCIPGFQPKNEESVMSLGLCLCEEHIPSCLGKDATSSAFQFFGEMSIQFFGPFFDWIIYFSGIELQELLVYF